MPTSTREQVSTKAIKILSSEARFQIMALLFKAEDDLCVNEIAEKIKASQSATSHQLSKLEAWGIISGERIGQTICYHPTETALAEKVREVIEVLE